MSERKPYVGLGRAIADASANFRAFHEAREILRASIGKRKRWWRFW